MPRLMPSHYARPGVLEANEYHQRTMQSRLSRIIDENLGEQLIFSDGFKPNLKLDSSAVKKYSGSPKFLDLENWVSATSFCFTLQRLRGTKPTLEHTRVMLLMEYLDGKAYE